MLTTCNIYIVLDVTIERQFIDYVTIFWLLFWQLFCIRELSICVSWYPEGILEPIFTRTIIRYVKYMCVCMCVLCTCIYIYVYIDMDDMCVCVGRERRNTGPYLFKKAIASYCNNLYSFFFAKCFENDRTRLVFSHTVMPVIAHRCTLGIFPKADRITLLHSQLFAPLSVDYQQFSFVRWMSTVWGHFFGSRRQ